MRKLSIGSAALIAACSSAQSSSIQTAVAGPASVSKVVVRTAQTTSGQPFKLPEGKSEMVAYAVEFPPNGQTTLHMHPWSRFVYVERGPLRVVNQDTGKTDEFQSGQVFPEVITQWHQGYAGPNGAKLVVIDIVPPGVTNMVMR